MWKRTDGLQPEGGGEGADGQGQQGAVSNTAIQRPETDVKRPVGRDVANIGKSVVIKGELSGSEDLTIEGRVEGKIELRQAALTIGVNGKIKAQVFAKSVIVLGKVNGNITAAEKVNIRDNGSVDGDLIAPQVGIAEGAHFRGSIDMQRQPGVARPVEAEAENRPQPSVPSVQGVRPH